MSNIKKELATELLIKELERRMLILKSERTELREQMITDLVKDLSNFVEIEQENIIIAFERDYSSEIITGIEYFYETFQND